ncbi:hypothetical protein EcE24377A_3398 [Escherichia coli O139:H28 str. E24377A]|uniref:Uncharacterized protein n=1 Tax=Escherichia coli O139:H28 (strain E24377A / ETEC) TaxID=331111 RepID=A7ZRG6_ECO24|nr:hypothetical protein EcE24377A_3398 [Escherichia coli O139:H28 str. E24377A]
MTKTMTLHGKEKRQESLMPQSDRYQNIQKVV